LPTDQKVTWRKDSALNDRGQQGEDLTGGYYDGKATHILYTQISVGKQQLNRISHNLNSARIIWIAVNRKCRKNKDFSPHFSTNATASLCYILASMGVTAYYVNYWSAGGMSEKFWAFCI